MSTRSLVDWLSRGKTYSIDLPLFAELGLEPFDLPTWQETHLGEVTTESGGKVKIWVTCAPAQFWRFEIETPEGNSYTVKTGSGAFSRYWFIMVQIAADMITIFPLSRGQASA